MIRKYLKTLIQLTAISIVQATELIQPEADVQADKFLSTQHPQVQGSANIVSMNDRALLYKYMGPVFIGEDMTQFDVTYSTIADFTAINSKNDKEILQSNTSKAWLETDGTAIRQKKDLGAFMYEGPVYNDTMCLIANGGLCVKNAPFIFASVDLPDNGAQGILGLARGHNRLSFVSLLKDQRIIDKAIVGINFEDPMDATSRSQVSFGSIEWGEIEGGEAASNFYSNLGREQWGLLIDDFLFDDQDMTNNQVAKIALLDSANVSIQLPQFVWDNVYISMRQILQKNDIKINQLKNSNGMQEMRIYGGNCDEFWQYLKPIEFKLEKTIIKINPSGYTYQEYAKNQGFCQVGLHTVENSNINEYRLGTVFLKNFYTALDYDRDLIIIGVNKGSSQHASATLIGHIGDPSTKEVNHNEVLILFLILFILLDLAAVIYFLFQKRKNDQEKKRILEEFEKVQQQDGTQILIKKEDKKVDQGDDEKNSEIQKVLKDQDQTKNYNIQNDDSMDISVDTEDQDQIDKNEEGVEAIVELDQNQQQ